MVGVDKIAGAVGAAAAGKPQAAPAMPFGGVLHQVMQQTAELDTKAQEAVTGLLSGQGVEVHEAMIATQRSDMAFELALQVRNKAVGAYQQMMSMQF